MDILKYKDFEGTAELDVVMGGLAAASGLGQGIGSAAGG